jgi:hypothetical protein
VRVLGERADRSARLSDRFGGQQSNESDCCTLVVRNTDAADRAAWPGDGHGRRQRRFSAHTLQHRVRALAACQFHDARNGFVTAFADDVGGAELPSERDAVRVAAQQDDAFCTQAPGRDHAAQSDGTIADHGRSAPWCHAGNAGCVVAGSHHVGQAQQRCPPGRIDRLAQREERAIGVWHPQRLGLGAIEAAVTEEAAVYAGSLEPFMAEVAAAVRVGEGHDHRVADADAGDAAPHRLDHADGLVAHALAAFGSGHVAVRPEVAAADAGERHTDNRIGGFHQRGIRDVDDAHIVRCVHHGG